MESFKNTRALNLLVDHMEAAATKTRSAAESTPRAHEPDSRVAGFALNYLDAFGYLKTELAEWSNITLEDIVLAIKQFQGLFSLPKSGQLTVRAVRAMELPRCGCPDGPKPDYLRMKAFIAANLAKWQRTSITYAIQTYLSGIAKPDFEAVIDQAFQAWSRVGKLNINRATGGSGADILISTGRGAQSNFDGAGGVLAWAYLPNGNDQQLTMKFDADEQWAVGQGSRGTLLFNVACHEFGHLVGLDHSRLQTALMAPYYNTAIGTPQAQDDIPRFQARYGPRTDAPVPPPPTPPPGTACQVNITGTATVTLNGRKIS